MKLSFVRSALAAATVLACWSMAPVTANDNPYLGSVRAANIPVVNQDYPAGQPQNPDYPPQAPPNPDYPPQTPPSQDYPPQTPPSQDYPPQTPPSQDYPPQTPPSQDYPPQTPPSQDYPPQTPPSQDYPPQTPPSQDYPPQTPPNQDYPPQAPVATPPPAYPANTPPAYVPAPPQASTPAPPPAYAPAPPQAYAPAPAPVAGLPEGNIMVLQLDKFEDGKISKAKVRVSDNWHTHNPGMQVTFNIPGVQCDTNTIKVGPKCGNYGAKDIVCKPIGCPENTPDGAELPVTVEFTYKFDKQPSPALAQRQRETQVVKRVARNCGCGSAIGDPHVKTIDNAAYDFHGPGVYTLFESGAFRVYIFQNNCGNALNWHTVPACIEGVVVVFGRSVVRLWQVEGTNRLDVSKGTDKLDGLIVKKAEGPTEGYRVFVKADAQTYVDVNIGEWEGQGYKFINVGLQAGAYFKWNEITGLLGNWNGNPNDDQQLAGAAKVENGLVASIFNWGAEECMKKTREESPDDLAGMRLYKEIPVLHQGYRHVDVRDIRPFHTKERHPPGKGLRRLNDYAINDKLQAIAKDACPKILNSIQHCPQLVKNMGYWEQACINDAVTVGCIGGVDSTKIAFLRECRRQMDSVLASNSCQRSRRVELGKWRKELTFGQRTCPKGCSENGECLMAGCKCKRGWSGIACDIKVDTDY